MSESPLSPLLQVQDLNLQTRRTQRVLLDNVSFSLNRGERVGMFGPRESGKTLLLKLLNRLIEPSSGQVYLEGKVTRAIAIAKLRQQIMLVMTESPLLGMTVQETLLYPLKLQNRSAPEMQNHLQTWMEELQIPQAWLELRESDLNAQQRHWIAIARALIAQPLLLLLDRPLQQLAEPDIAILQTVIMRLTHENAMSVITINPESYGLANLCTRWLCIRSGRLYDDSLTEDIDWQNLQADIERLEAAAEDDW